MRTVRNITVAVEPELYRQTRRIAVEYDTTVTDMVRFLLLVLPEAAKSARYPGGRPKFGSAAVRAAASALPATPAVNPLSPSLPSSSSPEKSGISTCTPANANKQVYIQRLASQKPAPVQDKHFSISTLKAIISKTLQAIPKIGHPNAVHQ